MSAMNFREPNQVLWRGVRPGHNGIQVAKFKEVSNDTIEIHPVTAGKILYLTSWTIGGHISVADHYGQIHINDLTPAMWYRICILYSKVAGGGWLSGNFWPPLEIPSSYTIELKGFGVGSTFYGSIHGWEE